VIDLTVSSPRSDSGWETIYVLDTNVLMHDPTALFRFAEHWVVLPMVVLQELDASKKGLSEVARNVRQVSRYLDTLVSGKSYQAIDNGLSLAELAAFANGHNPTGKLLFCPCQGSGDDGILDAMQLLMQRHPQREVVLVTKDVNLRIRARVAGLDAEDYFNDQPRQDLDLLFAGVDMLDENFWETHGQGMRSWQEGERLFYEISGPRVASWSLNQCLAFPGNDSFDGIVREVRDGAACVERLRDYRQRHSVWGVQARNREQNLALNLLMDPTIDLVTLTGAAGTGKTLLALAAGLAMCFDEARYREIIMTRITIPVGEDIGFLPGTEEEKMSPWMGALMDNLEVLTQGQKNGGGWGRSATEDLLRNRVKIRSLNFMRGRTFQSRYVILDEAQNLTAKQMKTLLTRAGPGTKMVCLGNLTQIDTPYLTETSSGLTYVVDRFRDWPGSGHITLTRGERSRLADFASTVL
jgi:PhoH-like ATPase